MLGVLIQSTAKRKAREGSRRRKKAKMKNVKDWHRNQALESNPTPVYGCSADTEGRIDQPGPRLVHVNFRILRAQVPAKTPPTTVTRYRKTLPDAHSVSKGRISEFNYTPLGVRLRSITSPNLTQSFCIWLLPIITNMLQPNISLPVNLPKSTGFE